MRSPRQTVAHGRAEALSFGRDDNEGRQTEQVGQTQRSVQDRSQRIGCIRLRCLQPDNAVGQGHGERAEEARQPRLASDGVSAELANNGSFVPFWWQELVVPHEPFRIGTMSFA